MAISFDKALGVHQHTLGVRAQRAEVIASNIANADTPGYKAKDVDFSMAMQSAMGKQSGLSMSQSHEKHFDLQAKMAPEVKFRVPNQADTGDGNTVDIQQEQTAFMQNALEYQMSLGFLDSKFAGLKKALKGN
ncbi:flagellar basal body rod protein FlgB [Shewanella sp. NIFS-20-20]|uniref:flagellar basal body rod protein FlgB n=1 Tax=Shewanella sp. NIFS-20-20 TaxID=2853806 RepID=UPI001C4847C9|nr:flagellar basal body rod protein FlgB [Shewanella sp. NIFS-20-20]MBV7314771.1 flagellar basal body rod protein FlgB [Shewanella sp. NIFS-20-20]